MTFFFVFDDFGLGLIDLIVLVVVKWVSFNFELLFFFWLGVGGGGMNLCAREM